MKQKTKFKQTEIGMIPKDWEVVKLKDVTVQIFSGGTPDTRNKKYWDGDLPWLSSGETRQTFIRDTERKITQEGVDNSSTRLAKKEDVVVAGAGQGHTRGQPSFCMIDTYINQSVIALKSNKKRLTPFFLFYNLLSRYNELRQLSDAHSSRGSLTTKLLADLFIQLPQLNEQEIISKILSDLDYKIELNQQMNKTLEAIGQAIFKHWFVDFEFPNEKGKSYKSSGGEMVESEVGEIPKGWKVGKFEDISGLQMGISPKGDSYNEDGKGIPLLNGAADFSGKLILPKKFTTEPIKKCDSGDLVFCIRATIGNVTFADKEFCLGRGVAALKINNDFREFFYYSLIGSLEEMISSATGSVIVGLSKTDIEDHKIIIPDDRLIKCFNKNLFSFFEMQKWLDEQIQILSQIRDSVSPKLMSGKIRVPVEVRR